MKSIEHAEHLGLLFDADKVTTPGSEHLYRDLLKLPTVKFRDVFERLTPLGRLYKQHRNRIRRAAAYLGVAHVLRPRATRADDADRAADAL
jgi:hypothetical protein